MTDGIKIKNFPRSIGDTTFLGEAERNSGFGENKAAFLSELHKVRSQKAQAELNGLLKRMDEEGQKLSQNRNVHDLMKYRELVKKFLAQVVGGSYQLREESGWDRRGRHKILVTVEKIDRQLEELAALVFSEQASSIEILAKVGEIKGMLMDIIT